jgi:hypothetical protein
MKRKLKVSSKKLSKGQKQKKSRETKQVQEPTSKGEKQKKPLQPEQVQEPTSIDFKQLQETVSYCSGFFVVIL